MSTGSVQSVDYVLGKLSQPTLMNEHAPRHRIIDLFKAFCHQSLLFVVAPIGYGKTYAALEYASYLESEHSGSTHWLTLDKYDKDPIRLWSHVYRALGITADNSFEEFTCDEAFLMNTGNALFGCEHDNPHVFLFIDKLDVVEDEDAGLSLIRLCQYTPSWFHVIILTNAITFRMDIESYKFGEMQIGIENLAYTPEEARERLSSIRNASLTESMQEYLYHITEGWAQGLVLAEQAIRSSSQRGIDIHFDGTSRYVRKYFTSNVRLSLSGEMLSFLMELSVLERFNRSLCDAVFDGKNTQANLDEAIRRNYFIVACDDDENWFRFNNLFADWLRDEMKQLSRNTIRMICIRASEWFHDNGSKSEAAKYLLLASDYDYVANLTEATCSLSRGDKKTHYLTWLENIPSSDFEKSPLLCMLCAWSYITNARAADAQIWIKRFELSVKNCKDEDKLDPSVVEFSLKCLTMKCAAMEGNGQEALALCEELQGSGYEIKPSLMSMIYQSLGEAYERIGEMTQAQDVYLHAQASASVDATMHQLMFNGFSFAEIQYYFGALDKSQNSCEKLLQTCPQDFVIYGGICAILARIFVERNEKERAARFIKRSLKHTSLYRHIDMYLEAIIAKAEYLEALGDYTEAYETVVEGVMQGEQKDVPRAMLLHSYYTQARIAAHRHNLRDLCIVERKFALRVSVDDVHCQLLYGFIQALIVREQGDQAQAASLFAAIVSEAQEYHLTNIVVRALVFETLSLHEAGAKTQAIAKLNDTLVLAHKHGFVRSLLCVGVPFRDLLSGYSSSRAAGLQIRGYAKSLLVEFEKELPSTQQSIDAADAFTNNGPDPLTPRELEILKLLNMGMSRQEISDVLCISVNTAKKHLANIYGKLGVGTREEALKEYSSYQ